MEGDLLEIVIYVVLLGTLPYVAVGAYDFLRRTIERRRGAPRH